MKLRLLPHWRAVILRAWSMRFMAAATLFSGIEAAVPYLDGVLPISRGAFGLLAFGATAAAMVSRVVAQSNLPEE